MIVIVLYIYICSLVLKIHLCFVLYLVNWFVQIAVSHFVTELFIAFDANSACLEVFKMSTAIVLCMN